MLGNYIKIAIRNLLRNKVYTILNILGLSLGMTCAIFLFLYVRNELNYDTFYPKAERIYQVNTHLQFIDMDFSGPSTPEPLAPALQREYPEVVQATRVQGSGIHLVVSGEKRFYEKKILGVDPTFFDLFSLDFIAGHPKSALNDPNAIILSRDLAKRTFGKVNDILGKTIQTAASGGQSLKTYQVSAVIENLPSNTSLKFSGLIPYQENDPKWSSFSVYTYLLLDRSASAEVLENKFSDFEKKYFTQDEERPSLWLLNLKDIHLKGKYSGANLQTLYIFSAIALLILLIASINYMNLATAQASSRAREIGIRKVVGSKREQLISQFLLESVILSLGSLLVSICLLELLLPTFNQLADRDLVMNYGQKPSLILYLFLIALGIGILSGSYPAFVLSSFKPVSVLKGQFKHSKQGIRLRKGLVILQFTISMILISATWIISQQMNYIRTKDLGYNQEQVIVVRIPSVDKRKIIANFKNDLLKNPRIISASGVQGPPGGRGYNTSNYMIETEKGTFEERMNSRVVVDEDYLNMMQIKLLTGRNFSSQRISDTAKAVLINEKMVQKMGWREAIGKKIGCQVEDGKAQYYAEVVGVFKDFHLASLHQPIEPLILHLSPKHGRDLSSIMLRLEPGYAKEVLAYTEKVWKQYDAIHPLDSFFLDQNFAEYYRADERRGKVFFIFSTISIFIACLGLFGLSAYAVKQRAREVSIRKILGASVSDIFKLMTQSFVGLILLANLPAAPLSYLFMRNWLRDFAYRVDISLWTFIGVSMIAVSIALVTVGFHAWQAARINPVNILKDE